MSKSQTLLAALLPSLLLVSGCNLNQKYCKGASGLLPDPAASKASASALEPASRALESEAPTYRSLSAGSWTRTVFTADSGSGFRVEVWDLLVGPGQEAPDISLPGVGVAEVLSGRGRLTLGGRPRELEPGATFALEAGERLGISNGTGEVPVTLRVHLVIAQ